MSVIFVFHVIVQYFLLVIATALCSENGGDTELSFCFAVRKQFYPSDNHFNANLLCTAL